MRGHHLNDGCGCSGAPEPGRSPALSRQDSASSFQRYGQPPRTQSLPSQNMKRLPANHMPTPTGASVRTPLLEMGGVLLGQAVAPISSSSSESAVDHTHRETPVLGLAARLPCACQTPLALRAGCLQPLYQPPSPHTRPSCWPPSGSFTPSSDTPTLQLRVGRLRAPSPPSSDPPHTTLSCWPPPGSFTTVPGLHFQ